MLTLRQRLSSIIAVVLVLTLGIVLYLFYGRSQPDDGLNENDSSAAETAEPVANSNPAVKTTPEAPAAPVVLPVYSEDLYVRQLTTIFVERFASYSNQNDRGNVTDSLPLATPAMQAWMKSQATMADGPDYQGTVTAVLASQIKEKTATTATVTFEAQQVLESKKRTDTGAAKKEIIRKNGSVKLLKVGSDWKIDGLYWN